MKIDVKTSSSLLPDKRYFPSFLPNSILFLKSKRKREQSLGHYQQGLQDQGSSPSNLQFTHTASPRRLVCSQRAVWLLPPWATVQQKRPSITQTWTKGQLKYKLVLRKHRKRGKLIILGVGGMDQRRLTKATELFLKGFPWGPRGPYPLTYFSLRVFSVCTSAIHKYYTEEPKKK